MNSIFKICLFILLVGSVTSCVSKKKFMGLQSELDSANNDLGSVGEQLSKATNQLSTCEQEKSRLQSNLSTSDNTLKLRQEQIDDLRAQIVDIKSIRDKQLGQVEDLTVLSQSANENIKETLSQLEKKDEYIHLIQAAKNRTDSVNLALAVNLKSVLNDGLSDDDVNIQVDKTVVFINLSDKMLYQSGSAFITSKASSVLGKIAEIIKSRPGLEVMVEGYTDNKSIKSDCYNDNWDLSVKRATSVVRELQTKYAVDPNRLIAAGRGEYNAIADNSTEEGRSTNRRTRIIIMPKLDEFYDLLNPSMVPE